jgi:hypothetical protein
MRDLGQKWPQRRWSGGYPYSERTGLSDKQEKLMRYVGEILRPVDEILRHGDDDHHDRAAMDNHVTLTGRQALVTRSSSPLTRSSSPWNEVLRPGDEVLRPGTRS